MSINTGTDISNLSPNTTYTFSVYPVNKNGQETVATSVSFTTLPKINSASLTSVDSSNQLTIGWSGSYYTVDVYYSTDDTTYNRYGSYGSSITSAAIAPLSSNQRYYFRLDPSNTALVGGTSVYVKDAGAVTKGYIATFSSSYSDISNITLNWTGVYSTAIIYYDTTVGTTTNSVNISTASTSVSTQNSTTVRNLTSGTTYYFTIYPYNSNSVAGTILTINNKTTSEFTQLLRYQFETINGTVVADSANTYNGTASTTSYYTSSYKHSGTYSMIASGTYVSLATNIPYTLANGLSFTIWIYQTSEPSTDQKFLELDHDNGIYLFIDNPSGKLTFCETVVIDIDLPLNSWVHIACTMTYTSSTSHTFKIYRDGYLKNTATGNYSGYFPSSSTVINGGRIGRSISSSHSPFNGYMDDFRLFNSVLSDSLILSIYNDTA